MEPRVDHDIAIIGGGVFGTSVAKHLSEQSDFDICLIEKENNLAQHQSGRNSGTLHPGLALKLEPGSRKAEFAIKGSRRLREYCMTNELPIRNTGLLLVATNNQEEEQLYEIRDRVAELDVTIELLNGNGAISELEPNIEGDLALYTEDSATVDTQQITYSLAREAWNNDVDFYMGTEVRDIDRQDRTFSIDSSSGDIIVNFLVNASGAYALSLAKKLGIATDFHSIPFRGQYYELIPKKKGLINTNVYPIPMPPRVPNQVGVHFTRRPDNKVIVGPTGMIALGLETYGAKEFDISEMGRAFTSSKFWKFLGSKDILKVAWRELNKTYRKTSFLNHCRKLLPEIAANDIEKSYVGISHYIVDNQGKVMNESVFASGERSFHILRPKPGLTSSLTIGEYVSDKVQEMYPS